MGYQKVFNKPYEEGYKNLPDKTTPVTAEILNMQDNTFESVEDYLENLTDGMPTDSFIELLQDYVPQVNPATTGDEPLLTGLSVGESKYRIPTYDDTEIREEISDVKGKIETTHTTTERTIEDASDGNIVALSLVGNTTQGANPSPSNPQPINGFSGEMGTHGKNLLNCNGLTTQTISGVTYMPVFENGLLAYINVNGSSSSATFYNIGKYNAKAKVPIILSGESENVKLSIRNSNGGTVYAVADAPFTPQSDMDVYVFTRISGGVAVNNEKIYPMIRLATETDPTYVPYKSSEIHTFPLYSIGDVKDELRVYSDGSGELIKRVKDITEEDYTHSIYTEADYFVLPTPTTRALTPSEVSEILKLKTYQGKTYVDAENVEFSLEYFADTDLGQTIADVNSKVENYYVDIKGKFAYIKTTVRNQQIPFPEGFTSDNSCILSVSYKDNNNNTVYGNDNDKIVIYISETSGLNCYLNGTSYTYKDLFIVLMRIE